MGVFSVFKRFIIIFFTSFLWFLLFINLYSFSGSNVFSNLLEQLAPGGYNHLDFSNSYFGFESLINAFADFPDNLFFQHLPILIDIVIEGPIAFVNTFNKVAAANGDWWYELIDGLSVFFQLFLLPLNLLVSFLSAVLLVLGDIVQWLIWICKIFAGWYNIPLA